MSEPSGWCMPEFTAEEWESMLEAQGPVPTFTPSGRVPDFVTTCHCGDAVTRGFDGNPEHTRGMCEHCDSVRCDANPGEDDR